MGKFDYKVPKKPIIATFMAGYFKMPDVLDFALNKYGLPSYAQTNIDIRYTFEGTFNGLDAQLLIARKFNVGNTYDDLRYVINKVDMTLYNLVLNYHF
jgi:hypothetical protein